MFDASEVPVEKTVRIFTYIPRLVTTGASYRDSMGQVPEEFTPSSLRHESYLIGQMRASYSPPSFMPYSEVFGIENGGVHARLMLSARLRVPRGHDPKKYETRGGRRYWKRLYVNGGDEMDAMVPESGAVHEFDMETHLPSVTEPPVESTYPFSLRFKFDPRRHETVLVIKDAGPDTDRGLVIEAARSPRYKHPDNSVRLVRDLV